MVARTVIAVLLVALIGSLLLLGRERVVAETLRAELAAATTARRPPADVRTTAQPMIAAAEANDASSRAPEPALDNLIERLKDPKYRSADLDYRVALLRKRYPDLAVVLGLKGPAADAVYRQLAQEEVDGLVLDSELERLATANPNARREARERRASLSEDHRSQRVSALGGDVANALDRYFGSMPARATVRELQMRLAANGDSLPTGKAEVLVQRLSEEYERHTAERQELRSRQGAEPTAAQIRGYMEQSMALIEESTTRRLSIARSVLTTSQVREFEAVLDEELAQARAETALSDAANSGPDT